MNKRAFSFVEIIISISILVVLAIVATTATNNIKNNSNNSKVIADLATLQNGFISMESEGNNLPEPDGNKNYYTSDGSYAHDKGEAYGVYGKVTQDTLNNRYLNITPLDPRTNQYYSYGVALDSNQFEVAGVIFNEEGHRAKVQGNYSAENGIYNLIRDHNSNNFVMDKGPYLPYNPEEKLLTAKDDQGYIYYEGDEVTNNTGGDMEIYFSDGSSSIISPSTSLVLTQMDFPKENNLVSKVKIFLDAGSIWTQATSLNEESSFDIFTTDTTASVRGTIFGVDTDGINTQVTVEKGEVEVKKIPRNITKEEIIEKPDVISEEIERAIYDDSITPEIIEVNTSISSGKVLKYDGNTTQELDISIIEKPEMNRIFSSITFEEKSIVSADDNVATIDTTVEEVGQSCYLGEVEILDGKSREDAYSERISTNCSDYKSPEPRYCNDGILEGDNRYKYSECNPPQKCPVTYYGEISGYLFDVPSSSLNNEKLAINENIKSNFIQLEDGSGYRYLETNLNCNSTTLEYDSDNEIEKVFCNEGYKKKEGELLCEPSCSGINLDGKCIEAYPGWEIKGYAPFYIKNLDNEVDSIRLYESEGNSFGNIEHGAIINSNYCGSKYNLIYNNPRLGSLCNDNGKYGVYIDNNLNDDYLKYSGLGLDDDFIIEIDLKGEDLKSTRAGDNYIIDIGGGELELFLTKYSNNYYVKVKGNNISQGHNILSISSHIGISNIDDDKYYRFIIIREGDVTKIGIKDIELINDDPVGSGIMGTMKEINGINNSSFEVNEIYVGSNHNKNKQWEGIIGSIRIMEKEDD